MWNHMTRMKLFHPTIKLLQCAESKEETELNSYSCAQGAAFHTSAKDSDTWRTSSWKCDFSKSELNSFLQLKLPWYYSCVWHALSAHSHIRIFVPSSSSSTLRAWWRSRPWRPSVMAASPLTAAVSCGAVLKRASATVNVYVHRSNAMCLCYMALWTQRPSESPRLVWDEGFMVGRTSEKNEVSEMKGWKARLVLFWCFCVWPSGHGVELRGGFYMDIYSSQNFETPTISKIFQSVLTLNCADIYTHIERPMTC